MSDFFRNGEIATFHRIRHREISEIEAELEQGSLADDQYSGGG
jgi:hypothetical protein